MVADGSSNRQIKRYLAQWAAWWTKTLEHWTFEAVLNRYIELCWDEDLSRPAKQLLQNKLTLSCSESGHVGVMLTA